MREYIFLWTSGLGRYKKASWETHKKVSQRLDASVLLRRGDIMIKGSRGGEGLGRKRTGVWEKEGKNQVWKEMEEMYRG